MSTDFKCNDGNEHDFDSNTESEYCAKGCGEKWAIYAIKKLGADLKEKDAAVEQLKAENICKDLKITIQHDKITALKSKLKLAVEALRGLNNEVAAMIATHGDVISQDYGRTNLECLEHRLGIARQALKEIEG